MVANVFEKPRALTVVKDAPAALGPGEFRAAVEWSGICGSGAQTLDVAQAERRRR
jgi:threonine dehydrogenase-like Zn-dependent dehydrogenase